MNQAVSIQTELLKNLTPAQKIEITIKLFRDAFDLKMKWLAQIHPDWSKTQVETETKKIFLYARS